MAKLLTSLVALLLLGARPPSPSVDYTLAPEMAGDAIVALRVIARFAGDRSGVTRFDWADSWAGEKRLGQWARGLTVDGAALSEPAPHGGRIIHALPGAPLTVSYRIVSAYAADPTAADSRQASPVVRPSWFFAVGEALFAVPEGRSASAARFTWAGPPRLGFASDLDHPRARPGQLAKTVADINESVVIGGRDLRVTRVEAGGAPLHVATIGRYGFDIGAFETLAQRIVAAERGFWRERDHQPFLIAMVPVAPAPNRLSYGGTGRTDAFALWMDPGVALPGLAWLLAHEYFHSWNYRQLGTMAEGDAEPLSYWMSEGFTDFYARRLMLRAGQLTPQQFADSWNETLLAYAVSPWRDAPDARVAAVVWTDRQAEKLPYQRGAMLAAIWDRRLAVASRGRENLDAVLRDQRRRVAGIAQPPLLTALFPAVAHEHGLDVRADIARYIDRGATIVLPPDTFGRCAVVRTVTRPVFARGWDGAATAKAGNVVNGLDPASPAYAAGLRDGMKITGRKAGVVGDSRVDYTIAVAVSGDAGERLITFRPAGKGNETLQELTLDAARFAAEPVACRVALAG